MNSNNEWINHLSLHKTLGLLQTAFLALGCLFIGMAMGSKDPAPLAAAVPVFVAIAALTRRYTRSPAFATPACPACQAQLPSSVRDAIDLDAEE